ncbi:MAG TPA: VOC family protein [Mycobacteriales bacterium]
MKMLTTPEILDAQLDDWRKLAQALHGRFATGDFATGLRFVNAVAEAAEAAGHHPDVTLTYPAVDLQLITHDAVYRPADGGPEQRIPWVTELDVDLARRISEIAREQGIAAEPRAVAQFELALDTADLAAAGPFWAALLTGSTDSVDGDDLRDPAGQVPNLWFQRTDAHEPPRQRFHVDLWLPHDVADERIAAAVAAGGHVVDDGQAPAFTVLADPEGNKACVCTFLDR